MKFLLKLGAMLILASIIKPNTIKSQDIGNWYMCNYCCKTKRAPSTPWENGCYSGQHQFQLLGKAGNFNYTCKNCKAEVYLISSQTPNASKCCNGITHSWYRK